MAKDSISKEHHQVINEYFHCWNQTIAYQRVYGCTYNAARYSAARLFANANISQEIQRRIDENAMTADEVLALLAEHDRGDMDDYLTETGEIDLAKARLARKTKLIKKLTNRRVVHTKGNDETIEDTTSSIELYDAQAALVQMGKHHKLFTDKQEIDVKGAVLVTVDR